MIQDKRIAFVGPKEYANVMRFAGFESFKALTKKEASDLIEELKEKDYALIFVSQDVAPEKLGLDRVVSLPGAVETSDKDYLKQEIIKAIGGEINIT